MDLDAPIFDCPVIGDAGDSMGKVVLVVDDCSIQRAWLKHVLEQEAFIVAEATDGIHALEVLGYRTVHLVISDVHMPRMDGIELAWEIKRSTRHGDTPVIMISADWETRPGSIHPQAVGVEARFEKPVQADTLLGKVSELLASR